MASAPTTFTSTKETTNYARLCRLLVDVGSQVLRDTFDKIHQPVDLHKALASAQPTLQSLRKKRILNPTQWGKLYPTISSSVSSANFDITLLVLLLRNICGLSPPATGWDSLPPATDTSIEANIARIKFYRNNVYGHVSQASVDNPTFDNYWKDISSAMVGLGAGASYADHITKLKADCMDPDIEEHYKDLLKEWKKDEENTKDKLGDMEEMLKKSKQDGESIKNKLERMEDKMKLMVESQQNLTEKLDKITKPKEPDQVKDYDDELYENYSNSDYGDFQDDDYGDHYDDLIADDDANNHYFGVLYSKETERLFSILDSVFKNELQRQLVLADYTLKLKPLMVDGKDLLSREVASNLSHALAIIDLACKDQKAFALSSLLQVPLINVDAIDDDTPHKYVMSVRPSYRVVCRAMKDVMDFYSFKRVAVVYDARKSRQASVFFAEARKWPRYNAEMMPELPLHDRKKTREALTALLKSHIKQVVLFCDEKDLIYIMNEALFVGINDKELKWVASDLEVAGDKKSDPSILGMVGLSLHLGNKEAARDFEKRTTTAVQEGAREFSLAMYAAVYDAALVTVNAMVEFLREDKSILSSHHVNRNCPLRSMKKEDNKVGQRMLEGIKKVRVKGLTGKVEFDRQTGERLVPDGMDILNVRQDGVEQVASWKPEPGDNENSVSSKTSKEPLWLGAFSELVKCHNPGNPGSGPERRLPKLTITTVLEPPFVEIKNKSLTREELAGKVKDGDLQGFLIDLIKELAKEAKFEYDVYLRSDTKYQNMIDELTRQERDMALAPITITAEREENIDFSKPFMDFSLSLIMQKPGEPPINNFAFLQPFTGGVWLSTIGVVLFITVMMCVMDFLTPFGYRARARESDDEPGNEFNLLNSLWFATASVLQQGPDNTPLAPSGRLLASTFWFFILILISTYTANLAAFFTIKRTADTINSLEALANQNEIKYGVMEGGSVMKFFESSEDSLYRKMFSHMREYKTFVPSTKAGVDKARKEKYAYITEYPYLEYYNQQKPCNTKLLKNLIQTKSYGIGLQRNSPYTNRITVAILTLREKNFIERARRNWWDDRSQCPKPSQSKTGNTQSLDVNNLAGVFIILLGGVVVSIVLLVIERRCKKLVDLLTNSQCRKVEYETDYEDIPMENIIRYVEPGIKQPNTVNLCPLDKYAYAPESKL